MKILVIIDDLMPGGTEQNLLSYMRHVDASFTIKIMTLFKGGGLERHFKEAGIAVDCVNLRWRRLPLAFIKAGKIIKEFAPDIVVCQRECARALFPLYLRLLGVTSVLMCFENPNMTRIPASHFLVWLQVGCVTAFVTPSSSTARSLRETYKRITQVEVIPNSVDAEKFAFGGAPGDGPKTRIISVGNLREEKNQAEILKVARSLKSSGVDFEISIVGEGHLRGMLEEQVKRHDLEREVRLLGKRDDVPALLAASDLFLFTSKSEGFGVAIIEAMAAGLPCVVYDLPVLRELDPHLCCIQVVPQNDTAAAVEAIMVFAGDAERRRKVGAASREQCLQCFSSEKIAKLWGDFYQRIAPGK